MRNWKLIFVTPRFAELEGNLCTSQLTYTYQTQAEIVYIRKILLTHYFMYMRMCGLQADRLVCTYLTVVLLQSVVHVLNADDHRESR